MISRYPWILIRRDPSCKRREDDDNEAEWKSKQGLSLAVFTHLELSSA